MSNNKPRGNVREQRDAGSGSIRRSLIPTSLLLQTLPPHYVIPAEAGTQVTYPLGIVEFLLQTQPPLRCDLGARLRVRFRGIGEREREKSWMESV
jgi:hypothetical protein